MGRALFDSGIEAFLVTSVRVSGAGNFVVFPPNLRPTSREEILEEAELKMWLK